MLNHPSYHPATPNTTPLTFIVRWIKYEDSFVLLMPGLYLFIWIKHVTPWWEYKKLNASSRHYWNLVICVEKTFEVKEKVKISRQRSRVNKLLPSQKLEIIG